jgi:hypothetical protein
VDVYLCTIENKNDINPDNLLINFWTVWPKWVELLFKLRNILVKPFGLSTNNDENKDNNQKLAECIRSGGSYKLFIVLRKNANETVIQLNDTHLSAEMSVHINDAENNKKTISTSTVVHFHNKLGRAYFFVIRPFHGIIVKSLIKNTLKEAE